MPSTTRPSDDEARRQLERMRELYFNPQVIISPSESFQWRISNTEDDDLDTGAGDSYLLPIPASHIRSFQFRFACIRCEYSHYEEYRLSAPTYTDLVSRFPIDCHGCEQGEYKLHLIVDGDDKPVTILDMPLMMALHEEIKAQKIVYCQRCRLTDKQLRANRMGELLDYKCKNGSKVKVCKNCFVDFRREEYIKGHSFNPQRFNYKASGYEPSKKRPAIYYGTELEINTKNETGEHAMDFEKFLVSKGMERFFYFKRDGSISNGYEIVTHPMTALARNELINWKAICDYLKSTGASSEESGECGLHIHASRAALNVSGENGNRTLAKMRYFLWQNRHQIHKLSRRTNYRYCEIEEYSVRLNRGSKKDITPYLNNLPERGNRYTALNVQTGKETFEFRFMRGTLDHHRLIATFQMVDALIHYARLTSVVGQETPYSWGSFVSWLRDINRYGHLERYLKAEKIK